MADNVFAEEEDPFSEYLQEQPPTQVASAVDPCAQLKLLVQSSQRQEEFLGKMCSLLLGMGEKLDQVSASQSRLVQQVSGSDSSGDAGRERGSSFQAGPGPGRGNVMQSTMPGLKTQSLEEEAAKRAQDLKIQEEDHKRRAAELAAKKNETERRAKEEAERQRMEEERRREEAKKQKALLSEKTSGLMSGLMGGADTDNDLFSDSGPKKKKGGLFDDDD